MPEETPKSAKSAKPAAVAGVNLEDLSKSITGDIAALFQGAVNDLADPRFQEFVTVLTTDTLRLASMKIEGAKPELLASATESLKARAQTIAGVPGLIAAGRQQAFMGIVNRTMTALVSYGFAALRTAAGIPSLPV